MDKILEFLKLQKRFAKFYNKGLISMSYYYIQIEEDLFFKTFKTFKVEKHKAYHYKAILNGIEIITLSSKLIESEETK